MSKIIGIDLGTTNSCVAVLEGGEPTVITNVSQDMRIFNEEIFGPVASIIKFSNDDEVLKLANSTDYGLASYIFTNNKQILKDYSTLMEKSNISVDIKEKCINLLNDRIQQI